MATTNPTPNMNLPVPVVGEDSGPDWANNLNACMTVIDGHNHSAGSGVPINPGGININSDFSMNSNDVIQARSLRMNSQSSPLSDPDDLDCVYVSNGDLFYNDSDSNQIQITQNGAVAGTPGSIANLVSPASASYVSANQTFVWQSDSNTPANMDSGSITVRNIESGSNGVTLSPPASLPSNYSITLPPLPNSQKFMTLDNAGNMAAPWFVDNSTIEVSSNIVQVKAGGITQTQVAPGFGLLPTGAIIPFGGTILTVPAGYLACDGSQVSRTIYANLFAVIGTNFGSGNGTTTFHLPGPQGYFMRFVSGTSGRDPDANSRTAMAPGGNTGNNVGSVQGHAFAAHNHGNANPSFLGQIAGSVNFAGSSRTAAPGGQPGVTETVGGSESRPDNFYVNAIIKT